MGVVKRPICKKLVPNFRSRKLLTLTKLLLLLLMPNSTLLQCCAEENVKNSSGSSVQVQKIINSDSDVFSRTPRSIAPFRVFKYISEDELLKNETQNSIDSTTPPPNSKKKRGKKGGGLKAINIVNYTTNIKGENVLNLTDPVLKSRATSVTDRSLIPNSFYDSQPQKQNATESFNNGGQHIKHVNVSDGNLNKQKPKQNNNYHNSHNSKDMQVSSSTLKNSFIGTQQNDNKNALAQNKNKKATTTNNESPCQKLERSKGNATTTNVNAPTISMSERPRRSPYRNRNQMMNQRQRQQQQQFFVRNQNPLQRRIMNNNNGNGQNRAPLYMRGPNPLVMPPHFGQMHFHNMQQQHQQFPGNMHNMNMRNNMMQNNNINNIMPTRGVAIVAAPQPQKVPQMMDQILPSPSSDFLLYQNPNNLLEEQPTWNHPMYRKYAKAAKNVQNKVSGLIAGGRPTNGRIRERDGYRTDFSKMPPIPLPRPKKRGTRPRNKERPPQGGRYSYPKSAQSIQDILDHFKHDNENDIMGDIMRGGHKGSGSRYPTSNPNMRHRQRERERDDDDHGSRQGPGAISDLSSELNDVRFSLLRDIREFAKRPSLIGSTGPSEEPQKESKDPIPLKSPQAPKPPRFMDRERNREEEEEEDEDDEKNWRKKHKYATEREDNNPHSPEYNHEAGFDDIFNPGPKPVRDLAKKPKKKSSRFRNRNSDIRDRADEPYSRKKDKADRDRYEGDPRSPYYDSDDRISTKHSSPRYGVFDDDSTERISKDDDKERQLSYASSVEIEKKRDYDRNNRETISRHRERDRQRDRDKERDRGESETDAVSYESQQHRQNRRPSPRPLLPPPHERPSYHDKKERERIRDYPKSINDKLRDTLSSMEYHNPNKNGNRYEYENDRDTRDNPPQGQNKPIVLKRPFEPYSLIPRTEITEKKVPQQHDYWTNNYASATERSLYHGYPNPTTQLTYNNARPMPTLPQVQLPTPNYVLAPPPAPTPTVLTPYYLNNNNNNNNGIGRNQLPTPTIGVLPTLPQEEEDYLEIHAGNGGFITPYGQQQQQGPDSMQKAYLELLHRKMQNEASFLNNQQQRAAKISSTTKKTPTPMRMKIHIYPNANDQATTVDENNNQQNSATGMNFGNIGNSGYFSGSSGYSLNTVPLLSPRHPQKVGGNLNAYGNGNNLHLRPGPGPSVTRVKGNSQQSEKNSGGDNKNVVLHLHVHRRNDVGPVELDAEGSDHFVSTDKTVNYKDVYDDHRIQDQNNQQSANNNDGEHDKSVSMEVPIHDDKIEDVLHTLLQFRDKVPTASSRKRRKRRK